MNFVSTPNIGTTFYFDLPQWHAGQETKISTISAATSNKYYGKILICEDDQDQALYLKTLFESSDFDVDIAANAKEAKDLLNNSKYDALLLDLILPDQDGISFIRQLRSNKATQDLPIIVTSIIAQTGRSLMNGDALSVVDWLDKPIDFNKLLRAVKLIKKLSAKGKPKILHIEDEHNIQEFVAAILRDEASVSFADSIKMAKEKLSKDNYDLVILDLILPDGNGVELLPMISAKHTPVVVFSNVELNLEYAKYVNETLVKSKNSNQILLEVVKDVLHKTH
jgi:DNA-binding response OmpR family regulator